MKTLVCIPCMDSVPTMFMESILRLSLPPDHDWAISRSSLIYDSRNNLSKMAVVGGFKRIAWIDSDMMFGGDLLDRLHQDLDKGLEVVSGLYFTRKTPIKPVVCSEIGYRAAPDGSNAHIPYAIPVSQYEPNSIFEVAAMGMGACMMDVSVIERVHERFGLPFSPEAGFGEDYSFCLRCGKLDIKMWCDSSIKLGHIAQTIVDEDIWLAHRDDEDNK